MKILVNISHLQGPKTGIEHYTSEILKRLLFHPQVEELAAFNERATFSREELQVLLLEKSEEVSESKPKRERLGFAKKVMKSNFLVQSLYRFWKRYLQRRKLAPFARQGYVYWEPNYICLPYDGPKVPVIHDLSDIECPEFHIAAKARWFAENIPISVAGACRVHSVSKYSQKRIEEVLKLPVSMIDLVPPGVDDIFKPQSEQRIREICGKYNLTPKRFILSVATLEPRKNLLGLFNAWKSLPDDLRRQYPLVLVGKKGWLNRELEDQLQSFIQTRQVVLTGYVPTEELPVFYSACCLFAYVSFYEGFGMPIAEALACKAQVLASNTTSMPEVGGNKAIYIDPENIVQMNAVLKKMLTANDRGHESFHSSPVFSWDDSVEKLLDSLSKCACEA